MQIREAEIFSFGKFHRQKFAFAPGINVIYGPNEAGKSTLHAFLMAMLFGMEKNRGRSAASEGYQRYEPWHAPAYYSGALRFEVEGKPFYLERNFYHKEKRDFLRNERDGEELSVAYGDLAMLLGGIDKETFGNTYNIPQSGAVTGKELSEALAEYLSDASESGNSSFHVARAVDALKEKKKKLNAQLKEVQSEKERLRTMLQMEQTFLEQDSDKFQVDASVPKEEDIKQSNKVANVCVTLTALLLVGVIITGILSQTMPYAGGIFLVIAFGLALLAIGMGILAGIKISMARSRRLQAEQAQQMLVLFREAASEKETRMYNISEQLEALELPAAEEVELQQELAAVSMAIEGIQGIAKEICEEAGDLLNAEVSRYVSAITEGKYDSVRVDENGRLWVLVDGKELSPDALSRGTLEQFYLALRLAVGKTVSREEQLPIFLDDAFALYDDERLEHTLRVLVNMNAQVLLFTCQKREAEILARMGAEYHLIQI